MIKKLLWIFLLVFTPLSLLSQITISTNSTSGTWSPNAISNSGATLQWEATGTGLPGSPIVINANDPTFDFSGNDGSLITVTVSSADNLTGLTNFRFTSGSISSANVANATALEDLFLTANSLSTIDVSSNTALTRLLVGNNNLNGLDISSNSGLDDVRAQNNNLSSTDLDNLLIALDGFGLSNGNIQIAGNLGSLTTTSLAAYNSLEGKGWIIDVAAPVVDNEPPVIGTLNAPSNLTQTGLTLTWTAATDNVGVTNYKVFQDNVEIATIGNVLTYNVTGLTANTNYDFHITALDAEGNESANSNTQNVTTLPTSSSMTIFTTSGSSTWSPVSVSNSGATLEWSSAGTGFTPEVFVANDPTFNLAGNAGTATITINSSDNFGGLTNFRLPGLSITGVDLSAGSAISTLFLNSNNLSSVDISGNTSLSRLLLSNNSLTALDISNNPLLDDLRVNGNSLPSAQLDALVIALDAAGISDGNLQIDNNAGVLTSASLAAYNSLEAKGWIIDVAAPVVDNEPPVIGTLNAPTNITQTGLTLSWTAATDNVGVTNYKVFQDNVEIVTLGNVLTYDVTGLTANTNYDFHITALDAEGNESANSNTQNVTTLPSVSTMTIFTTSGSSTWSPTAVSNSGATLQWSSAGTGFTPEVFVANDPTFNLAGNAGTATITIESTDNFTGLSNFRIPNLAITGVDLTAGSAIGTLFLSGNSLTTIDLSGNVSLERLLLSNNALTAIEISANSQLDDLRLNGNSLTSDQLDAVVIALDGFGLSNGNLQIGDNAGSLTSAALTAYNNLESRGWIIDVAAPVVDTEPPVIGTLNAPTNIGQTGLTLTWTAATDNVGVTNYKVFQDNVEIATIGNVLTYDVTGLTANTNYDFHITALDNEGNESANSNTQNVTTLPTSSTMVLTTTSTSGTWSPTAVTNSGNVLRWSSAGTGFTPEVFDQNDPTFNLTGNTGVATITIESTDNFSGLTNFRVPDLLINSADVMAGTAISALFLNGNDLTTLDVSGNVALTRLILSGNSLTQLDISNNPLLDDLRVANNALTATELDNILIALDGFGLSNGNLQIANNAESLTSDSFVAYNSLTAKGWSIDVSAPPAAGPEITITGNGISIASNAPAQTDNGTNFGETLLGNPLNQDFVLENSGDQDLIITLFFQTSADFPTTPPVSLTLTPGATENFSVLFNPTTLGGKNGSIIINSNASNEPVFVMLLEGSAVEVLSNQIMISQYYSGFSVNDKWIEVANISGGTLAAGSYYLALYDEGDIGNITTSAPTQSVAIPEMAAGEVLLFRNPSAALPLAGNIGSATQISTSVCTFDGVDDVILISTSNGTDCYADRQDILGTIPGTAWGDDTALIKGGCATEEAHKDYDPANWIRVNSLNDVDTANPTRNIALGTQVVGPTEFDGSSWSNLPPDQSREVIITQSFSGAGETIEACNITINSGVNVVFDSNGATKNSIVVYGDLNVNGSLLIGDTESLVTYGTSPSLGVITKIENSTPLNNEFDNTYWSSPVQGAVLSTVFAGVDPNRIFELKPADVNPIYAGTEFEHWWIASGSMAEALGYSAQGTSAGVQTITFTGVPNHGTFTRDLYYKGSPDVGSESDNFNLIGNPYPTAIDIELFLLNNSIVNSIYLWTHATPVDGNNFNPADYVTYTIAGSSSPGVTKNIGSGQGFMARAEGFGSVAFGNTLKMVDSNDQFYKSTNKKKGAAPVAAKGINENRIWLKATNGLGVTDDMLIAFLPLATDEFDSRFDARYVNYNKDVNLYANLNDDKLVIQTMGIFDQGKKVALGFDTKTRSDVTISISKLEGSIEDAEIYLVDAVTEIRHDLRKADYLISQAEIGEYPNRFSLEFVSQASIVEKEVENRDNDKFMVTSEIDVMNVNSDKSVNFIKVYDLLGRVILQETPKKTSFQLDIATVKKGTVMVIEARLEDGSLVNRKSIKY